MNINIDHDNPETVFRYRPISVNSLYEISTSSFYLAKPSDFNDPFDCDFFWNEDSEKEIKDHILFAGNEVTDNELDKTKKLSQDLKMICARRLMVWE